MRTRSLPSRAHEPLPGPQLGNTVPTQVSYVIDIDPTVVTSHSDKQGAAPSKHGYGFHPHVAYLDATGEALAGCSVGQCGQTRRRTTSSGWTRRSTSPWIQETTR